MQPSLFSQDTGAVPASGAALFRRQLNEAQYEAATCVDGPVLVIAGAGSGKTRTLVYRLACLVDRGVPPESILLLTFTRRAAQEMLNRASRLLDESCSRITGGTFHAVASLLLRRHGRLLGYAPNFTIIDQGDAEGIVNLIKSSLDIGGDRKRFPSRRVIAAVLSKSINKGVTIEALLEDEYGHLLDFLPEFCRIRDHYQRFKFEHGLMDYDDLLINWQRLLVEHPDLRAELGRRFSYLMVDEYQDTNPVQAGIVRLMATGHDNVMVVGDDSQSIYSFRGADFRNIMEFPRLFPAARLIRLEENYRSTQAILDLTNAVIERAEEKYAKRLFTRTPGGEKPVLHGARDEGGEARFVVDRIMALRAEGVGLDEMAVLFRSGYHAYRLELELTSRHLAFEKRGGLKLTESAHIKDVLAYLRVVVNPADHLSWNRLFLQIDKVGPKTAQKLLEAIRGAADPLAILSDYPAGRTWRPGLAALADLLRAITGPGFSPQDQLGAVLDFYTPQFERIYYDDYPRRARDLEQLRVLLAGYDSLPAFLDDTSLDPPQENAPPQGNAPVGERLVLSTVHSAKGLEWDVVFVIHLTDGRFPSAQALTRAEREEERRLLYVAATRARRRLFLVYPRQIMSPERMVTSAVVSPFIEELSPALLQGELAGGLRPASFAGTDDGGSVALAARKTGDDRGTAPAEAMRVGTLVRHHFFGEGRVEALSGTRSVEVFFSRHGRKTLHLDYARLEVV